MLTRIISGAVLAAIGIATGLLGGPVLNLLLLFCALIGMNELYKATGVITEQKGTPPFVIIAYCGAVLYYAALYFLGERQILLMPIIAVLLLIIMVGYVITFPKYSSTSAIITCFGFLYLPVMLGCMYLTRAGENGIIIMWLIYLSSWGADTAAYFAGRFFGKHKMAPVLSPKKTIEGAVGGILGSGLFGVLFSFIVDKGQNPGEFFVICAVGAVISIFGDLTASAIKRDHEIKDYGHLIPGHGGILDRFDSVIFTAPVIYLLSLVLM